MHRILLRLTAWSLCATIRAKRPVQQVCCLACKLAVLYPIMSDFVLPDCRMRESALASKVGVNFLAPDAAGIGWEVWELRNPAVTAGHRSWSEAS
ncbi:hypothetical protein QBC33DRAFT_528494 [Phialemonium atrogriseum]|uniref:Secreted protein n=1 Tax=Phialemonium atrogriseum TaxID=1093897 RepID=A0AAJ0C6T3_9PEZI|nr:uncharacterized protein QBC33DRAFT_528494 [Phialemonium atrogriseum]KAK1770567.1 hypothetical protein QBC33DRAFT_528494 [Phialemonium atrogriseum]